MDFLGEALKQQQQQPTHPVLQQGSLLNKTVQRQVKLLAPSQKPKQLPSSTSSSNYSRREEGDEDEEKDEERFNNMTMNGNVRIPQESSVFLIAKLQADAARQNRIQSATNTGTGSVANRGNPTSSIATTTAATTTNEVGNKFLDPSSRVVNEKENKPNNKYLQPKQQSGNSVIKPPSNTNSIADKATPLSSWENVNVKIVNGVPLNASRLLENAGKLASKTTTTTTTNKTPPQSRKTSTTTTPTPRVLSQTIASTRAPTLRDSIMRTVVLSQSSTSTNSTTSSSSTAATKASLPLPKAKILPTAVNRLKQQHEREQAQLLNDEIATLLKRKSSHAEEAEDEWFDGFNSRMNKLAKKEEYLAKESQLEFVVAPAFYCKQCDIMTEVSRSLCQQQHPRDVQCLSVTKRFFECNHCHKRSFTLGKSQYDLPSHRCESCDAFEWKACGRKSMGYDAPLNPKLILTASEGSSRSDITAIKSSVASL